MNYPIVYKNIDGENKAMSLADYDFLKRRTINISGEINDVVSERVISQISYLEEQEGDDRIWINLNSAGGGVYPALAIIDKLKSTHCTSIITVKGLASSAAALILSAGTFRRATVHSDIMVHQPRSEGSIGGTVTDMETNAMHAIELKNKVAAILAENTGNTLKTILELTEKDYWLTPSEAIEFGIIDEIEGAYNI